MLCCDSHNLHEEASLEIVVDFQNTKPGRNIF